MKTKTSKYFSILVVSPFRFGADSFAKLNSSIVFYILDCSFGTENMACHSGAIFIAVTLCVCISIANTVVAMYGSHWAEIEAYDSNGDKSYYVSSFFLFTNSG